MKIQYGRFQVEHVHEFSKEWKSDENSHWHECPCGERSGSEAHDWQWITDKEATASEPGLRHQECRVCGIRGAEENIPVTAVTDETAKDDSGEITADSSGEITADGQSEASETVSDEDHKIVGKWAEVLKWVALSIGIVMAMAVIVGIVIYKKSEKKRRL